MKLGRILLVEDEAIGRKVIADTLLQAGYQVDAFENAEQALAFFHHSKELPQLIILDFLMPEMNGMELLERLKTEHLVDNIPVVMLTAVKEYESIVDALEAGVNEYLTKPVDPDQLLSLVKEMISHPS